MEGYLRFPCLSKDEIANGRVHFKKAPKTQGTTKGMGAAGHISGRRQRCEAHHACGNSNGRQEGNSSRQWGIRSIDRQILRGYHRTGCTSRNPVPDRSLAVINSICEVIPDLGFMQRKRITRGGLARRKASTLIGKSGEEEEQLTLSCKECFKPFVRAFSDQPFFVEDGVSSAETGSA